MREVRGLPMPDGPTVLEVLPALRDALSGHGPALLPGSESGGVLGPDEDDAADPTALVIATSGSTGEAKDVLLPASALRSSAEATHARLGGPGRWLLAMPARHVAGVQVLVRSLLAGIEPGVMPLAHGFSPETFARAAHQVLDSPGRQYTALVPTQLVRLLDAGGAGLDALASFHAVLLGGAATPPELRARAEAYGVRVIGTYGMSETSGGCVYDGHPLDGVRVSVSGDGAVWLAGPVLARGYRGRPELTAQAFVDGWFRTGDLGRLLPDGRLELLGRADDVIITGGVNVPPVLVERALGTVPGVREACVLGVPDEEWGEAVAAAVVPVDPAAPQDADVLRGAVREQAGRAAVPKRILFLPELPVRGPGKPDRVALRQLFTRDA
ncbi:MAG: AMP-binding protein [Pseudonocardiaceae bacterium]|nr:AMP-binding protein [Pseudonocardiaceae bacterium]